MRLIDCNSALRKVEQIPYIANENKVFHEGCRYMQKRVLRVFHESKTIDAEPVRHGRWVMKETMVRSLYAKNAYCSECLEETSYHHNYCPNCGADMREGN